MMYPFPKMTKPYLGLFAYASLVLSYLFPFVHMPDSVFISLSCVLSLVYVYWFGCLVDEIITIDKRFEPFRQVYELFQFFFYMEVIFTGLLSFMNTTQMLDNGVIVLVCMIPFYIFSFFMACHLLYAFKRERNKTITKVLSLHLLFLAFSIHPLLQLMTSGILVIGHFMILYEEVGTSKSGV
ncbi:hypothetical protein [Bacillus kexueae]|uniref:hypothetical protein n=1 Tax=Aeribacillus kexueae TaxID=2078952 RepID=UPI001FAF626C|nr:hypothetical protein [Bacillus kexueae]